MTVPAHCGYRCYREPQAGPHAEKWFDADHPDGPGWFIRLNAAGRAKVASILAEYPHPVAMLQRLWPSSYARARTLGFTMDEIDSVCMQGVVLGVARWEPGRGAAISTVVGWALRAECAQLCSERRYTEHESSVSHLWSADPEYHHVGPTWLEPAARPPASDPDAAESLVALIDRADLTDRERAILRFRYMDGLDLQSVGRLLRVSKERVRQLQVSAMAKLRVAAGIVPPPTPSDETIVAAILDALRYGPYGMTALLDLVRYDRREVRRTVRLLAKTGRIHSWFAKLRGGRRAWRFGLTKPKAAKRKAGVA